MSPVDARVLRRAISGSTNRLCDEIEQTRSNIYERLKLPCFGPRAAAPRSTTGTGTSRAAVHYRRSLPAATLSLQLPEQILRADEMVVKDLTSSLEEVRD